MGGNEWTIDGATNNGVNRQMATSPNSDMLQEMRVETTNFAATVGHGTGVGISVREIANTVAGLLGRPELVDEVSPAEKDPLGFVVADATRLRGLGWKPTHTLREGLEKLLAHGGPP